MNANSLWGRDGGGDRRLWLILILSPRCCHADKMISPAIIVYDKYKGDFFNILENDNLLYFYYSLKRENNLLDDRSSEQAVVF